MQPLKQVLQRPQTANSVPSHTAMFSRGKRVMEGWLCCCTLTPNTPRKIVVKVPGTRVNQHGQGPGHSPAFTPHLSEAHGSALLLSSQAHPVQRHGPPQGQHQHSITSSCSSFRYCGDKLGQKQYQHRSTKQKTRQEEKGVECCTYGLHQTVFQFFQYVFRCWSD